MPSKLFEYAVIYHPKAREKKEGDNGEKAVAKSQLLVPLKSELAASDKEIAILAARAIPAEYLDKLDQIEIVVRPFN